MNMLRENMRLIAECSQKLVRLGENLWGKGSVEEEIKPNIIEEAKTYWDSIKDAWICPDGYIFKDENGNEINATKIVLEKKKKKEYTKGAKVRHKTKGMVETIVGVCKIKYMGAWVDGVIYEGNDTNTGEPMTFVRVKEDFENNFEIV